MCVCVCLCVYYIYIYNTHTHMVLKNSFAFRCSSWHSLGKNTRVSCHFLLQGLFFPIQGSNPHLFVSCIGWQVLYH